MRLRIEEGEDAVVEEDASPRRDGDWPRVVPLPARVEVHDLPLATHEEAQQLLDVSRVVIRAVEPDVQPAHAAREELERGLVLPTVWGLSYRLVSSSSSRL